MKADVNDEVETSVRQMAQKLTALLVGMVLLGIPLEKV
jgi:hypothetical protein